MSASPAAGGNAGAGNAAPPGASMRTGPSTVLDRAVLEHNVLASGKIYAPVTFAGLGALLDLTPAAALSTQNNLRGAFMLSLRCFSNHCGRKEAWIRRWIGLAKFG